MPLTFAKFLTAIVAIAFCFAAIGAPRAEDSSPQPRRDPNRRPHLLIVLIGGIDSDPTAAQIRGTARRDEGNSGLFRLAGDITRERIIPEYFNWNGTRVGEIKAKKPPGSAEIADFIRGHLQKFPGDRVALVGNSWGGHTALEVAERLSQPDCPLALNLVVFLDASSTGRGPAKPKSLPVNVNRAVSYFTRNMFVWGKWDAGTRLKNIDLGDPKNSFIIDGQPPYDARLDAKAHIAAEWDEAIHKDIASRLLTLVPVDDGASDGP